LAIFCSSSMIRIRILGFRSCKAERLSRHPENWLKKDKYFFM